MKRKLTLGLVVTLAGVIAAMNVHLNRQLHRKQFTF
jgi:hypothetical protein